MAAKKKKAPRVKQTTFMGVEVANHPGVILSLLALIAVCGYVLHLYL